MGATVGVVPLEGRAGLPFLELDGHALPVHAVRALTGAGIERVVLTVDAEHRTVVDELLTRTRPTASVAVTEPSTWWADATRHAHLVLVDQEPLLELRRQTSIPVACIVIPDSARGELADVTRLEVGRQLLRFHPDFPQDKDVVGERCAKVPADADLCEPLERVSDALKETLRASAVA